jgi:hypothetical protein
MLESKTKQVGQRVNKLLDFGKQTAKGRFTATLGTGQQKPY